MKKFLVFCTAAILVCLWSRAQFNFFDQAFLGQGTTVTTIPDPTSVPGLEFWWVSSDLTNDLIVTNWLDRIQGSVFTNGANSLRPTNSSSGVGFNGSTFLTNKNVVVSNSTTMVLIYTPHTIVDFDDIIGSIPASVRYHYLNSGQFGLNASSFYTEILNSTKDSIVCVCTPDAPTAKGYTNGILFGSSLALSAVTDNLFGLPGPPGDNKSKFHLLEFMWYTNNISSNATWVAAIHKYATNKYSFTP